LLASSFCARAAAVSNDEKLELALGWLERLEALVALLAIAGS
jgi:hypothetical protein